MPILALLIAWAVPPSGAYAQDPPATTPTTIPATTRTAPALTPAQLVATIADSATGADEDRRLAQRLIADDRVEAVELVETLLRSEIAADHPGRTAVLYVLARSPSPRPEWLEALALLVRPGTRVELARPAARALSNIGTGPAMGVLIALSDDSTAPIPSRQLAIDALSRRREREAIVVLRSLLDEDQPEIIAHSAGQALATVSGQPIAWDDTAGWIRWADATLALDASGFARLMRGAAELQAQRRESAGATEALSRLARRQYVDALPEQKAAVLASYLADSSAELRVIGARLALEELSFDANAPLGDASLTLMRQHVMDPSPEVRFFAAQFAAARNDASALPVLLEQLRREPDGRARLAQVEAIAPMRNAAALPLLIGLLDDSSPAIRRRAALVASTIAIAANDPAIELQLSGQLQIAYNAANATTRDGQADRAAFLEAVAALRDPSLVRLYIDLLTGETPVEIREMALRGLARQRDPNTTDAVVPSLRHPNPRVRQAAVTAFAATAGFARAAQPLAGFFDESGEPDAEVRTAAWNGFLSLLPTADRRQLAAWPDRFNSQPERRLVVLTELARRDELDGNLEQLAFRRDQMAETLAGDLKRYAEAAAFYEQALDYELRRLGTTRDPSPVALSRTREALNAFLRAGRLDEATRFVQATLTRMPKLHSDIGATVRLFAQSRRDAGQVAVARDVIESALKWNPGVDDLSRRQLTDLLSTLVAAPGT